MRPGYENNCIITTYRVKLLPIIATEETGSFLKMWSKMSQEKRDMVHNVAFPFVVRLRFGCSLFAYAAAVQYKLGRRYLWNRHTPIRRRQMQVVVPIMFLLVSVIAGCAEKQPEQASSNSQAELLSQERVWNEAYKNRDKEALTRVLADEFTFTDDAGQVSNKAQYISAAVDLIKVDSYTVDDTVPRIYVDTGIVTGRWTGRMSIEGKDASGAFRFTDVFVRRDGRWQVVASQDTRLPEPQNNR
jgi:ketosteroid isomerase-like protein